MVLLPLRVGFWVALVHSLLFWGDLHYFRLQIQEEKEGW